MKRKKLTEQAIDVIVKLATSQGWGCQWILDGKTAIQESLDSVHWVETLRTRKRNLLAMAQVLVGGDIYEPEPPAMRTWHKTGYVAILLGLTTSQLTSLVYRAEALGLTKPNLRTGKAQWSELDIACWLQYQKEGRLPLRRK